MRGIKAGVAMAGILLFAGLFISAAQIQAKDDDKGKCGQDVYWSYDWKSATLTVSGKGEMLSCGWMENEDIYETMEKAVIEEGVTSICHSAFSPVNAENDCNFLEKGIKLPSTLRSIGDEAFAHSGLQEMVIPAGLEEMGSGVFKDCSFITTVNFPDHLTRIEKETFADCRGLEKLTIPSSVTYIGEGAFAYCDALQTVTLPDSVKEMGKRVFRRCDSLQTVKWGGAEKIPPETFYDCRELKTVELPEGLLEIQDNAFRYCGKLEKPAVPGSVRSIGKGAFSYCVSIKELTLPESVMALGEGAFEKCAGLKKIGLPNKLTVIPKRLFSDCISLESIHIPDSVQRIEANALEDCASLKTLIIPAGVTGIAPCHQNCPSLHKIINQSQTSYSLEASKPVMNWYRGGEKVTVVKPGETVTGKGKKFKISYNKKQMKKYKIQVKGKLPKSYTYGKEPKLPKTVTAGKKNHCFMGWRYKASGKKFQSGAMRTWYNAYIMKFSHGIKGNIVLYPIVYRYTVKYSPKSKTESAYYWVEAKRCEKKYYYPADFQEFIDKKSYDNSDGRIDNEEVQVQYSGNKKMKKKKQHINGGPLDFFVKTVGRKAWYTQFRNVPELYWGVSFEACWSQIIKLKKKK